MKTIQRQSKRVTVSSDKSDRKFLVMIIGAIMMILVILGVQAYELFKYTK